MTTPSFVHLHVHSHFSLLDGAITIPDLVRAAKDNGMDALALTDHGNLFGAIQFYRKCREAGIKPIIGMEAYLAPESRFERKKTAQGAYTHLNLLARNAEGYRNLLLLSSLSYLEGFYYKPRIDKEILRRHSKGIIGLSACLSSEINRKAVDGTIEEVRAKVSEFKEIFEPGYFFLELQRNGIAEQERIIERVPAIGRELGVPLLATNDIHYLRREDARAQEVHLCINTGSTMDDSDRMRFGSEQFYFRSGAEMERVLGDFPEALTNTHAVADLVDLQLDFSTTHLPVFIAEGVTDHSAYLRAKCEEGLRARYPSFDRDPEIRKRLDYELSVIERTGYVSYFLIVWDFIRFAREAGVPVGPGRGSAAGSLVAYALGITDIDPLRYDLLFERFLNADRVSMPDIDIDFCMDKRGQVIDYVKRKYGADRVCQIITFGTMAARAVIRDVGRVLNLPLALVDSIAKKIPAGPGVELKESLEQEADLKALAASDPRIKELFDLSLRLEGLNRHASTHAAGVVIGDSPLIELLPLYKNGDDVVTQFSMEDLEACGILKMDFLGLRNLTVIDAAVRMVERARGDRIDPRTLPLDDRKTYELLCRGDSSGVFQLESNGMRDLLRRLKPDRFEDVIAILALYRPGPLGSGMVDSYIKCKHGQEKITYEHPLLEPILKETNGVILYQEQVMRIANHLAGFSLTEADSLRKAMGKKKPEIMAKFQAKFIDGCASRGVEAKLAERIWDLMVFFAGYGFNKSHSTAYAVVTYQTAWLKANYPTEYMAALMTCEMSNTDKLAEYLEECRRLGIEILPPDVNRSQRGFTVSAEPPGDRKIWYGLEAIKGLGEKAALAMIAAREKGGPYTSIFDFAERVESGALNKTVLEGLIACGALDSFKIRRSQLFAVVEAALQRGARHQEERRAGQQTLFELFEPDGGRPSGSPRAPDGTYPDLPEWPEHERLSREKQTLGFYLSGHPLRSWEGLVKKFATHTLGQIGELENGTEILACVLIAKVTKKISKKSGEPFWIALVEDLTGSLEIYVNQDLYEAAKDHLREESIVFLKGFVRYRDTTPSISVQELLPVEGAPARLTTDLSVVIPIDDGPLAEERIFRLKGILQGHRGDCPVYLVLKKSSGERAVVQVGRENYIAPDQGLLSEVEGLCGQDGYFLNRMRGVKG
jgi:DNA polymerase III subunit alpha